MQLATHPGGAAEVVDLEGSLSELQARKDRLIAGLPELLRVERASQIGVRHEQAHPTRLLGAAVRLACRALLGHQFSSRCIGSSDCMMEYPYQGCGAAAPSGLRA